MGKLIQKYVNAILYGVGICQKCGAKDVRFTAKGNLVNHNGCRCRKAVQPVGFFQANKFDYEKAHLTPDGVWFIPFKANDHETDGD